MVMPKVNYEEIRKQRMEENQKKLEQLNLPMLSQSLRSVSLAPKTPPMKRVKPRVIRTEMVPVRRSGRLTDKPAPVYAEVPVFEGRQPSRRRGYAGNRRNLDGRVYASDKARAWAIKTAEKVESSLKGGNPSFVKPMLQSHVTGGFWMGLPCNWCKKYLPRTDATVTLIDEQGEEFKNVYLAEKKGLSGGWRGFAMEHELVDGDALVFELVRPATFKVHITRQKDSGVDGGSNEYVVYE